MVGRGAFAGLLGLLFGALPLSAQEHTPAAATQPPEDRRVYFLASLESPLLVPLLSQHGCAVPEAGWIRVELPGRVFATPVQLAAKEYGRPDPLSSMCTQWALLEAGDVERAVAGWVPEERPTARALLSDPSALERYRDQAAAVESARVDALVWFEDELGGEPVAALIADGNPTGFTLGMPTGFRRNADGEFLLTVAVARDARFGIVGAAAREGTFGQVGSGDDDAGSADVVTFAEACGESG